MKKRYSIMLNVEVEVEKAANGRKIPWFKFIQLVEKLRCILPLPNLFPSLARRFACCQSCSVSLRTLWAYGFDSATRRALEKSKVGES